jgi:predicted nucleic acid-binding protein
MILLDSGYFIALFNPNDDLHTRAQLWSRHVEEALLVTEYVVWECVNAFSKPADRASAQVLVDHVRGHSAYLWIDASPVLFEAGLALHRDRPDKEWSLTDCVSFHLMSERGITRALAYDQHFEQAGFEALLRHDPPS